MGHHRADKPGRRDVPSAGRRRAETVRPRYGRLAVLGASVSVTGIAMLGGVGILPSVAQGDTGDGDTARDRSTPASAAADPGTGSLLAAAVPSATATPSATEPEPATTQEAKAPKSPEAPEPPAGPPSVPEDSGEGYRVVFDESAQRVWLVGEDEEVVRTYLVSGSVYDNLDPGTYEVYSRSEDAVGIDDSGTMKWFVRFTQGDNGAAIGFHSIPVDDGAPVQTVAQLGTPLSHGCIRQRTEDALALWDFAPIGTEVDVVA